MTITGPIRRDIERTRDRVFTAIRAQLISGAYRPGEKIKLRPLADALGTSITPVREALLQLVVAGALIHDRQHSVRVPILTAEAYRELRDLRLMLECEVAEVAATTIEEQGIAELERLSLALTPRPGLDIERYKADVARFHFTLYRAAPRPATVRLIETLWLQTGPYMNYLFPDYLKIGIGPRLRGQICRALRRRDAAAVRRAIESDLTTALNYIADRLEAEQNGAVAA
ncbi:MAG: GntR family transcriptional regulator [Acetobacteraceae bacterium]|nr:GntR family transcriptional regulator [Acetobacteraceae bacterium]